MTPQLLSLRRTFRSARDAVGLVVRDVRFRLERPPADDAIRVFYGHRAIPGPAAHVSGGLVKIQRMQRLFPNVPGRFNVLYMVSSQPPSCAGALTRLAHRHGAGVVWNQDGVAYPAWYPDGWQALNAAMREVLHSADHVFFQSAFCRMASDHFLGRRTGAAEILYNAVDTDVFTPAEVSPDGPITILVGGTQDVLYRLSTALEALAIVAARRHDVRMIVTGRLRWRPDERSCRREADRLAADLRVTEYVEFVGPYTQAEAPQLFRRAHLMLHAKYNDPCPGIVIEALACGLPVVYSATGGVPELVGECAGVGVPTELSWEREIPPPAEAVAEALVVAMEHRADMAAAARARAVERFDIKPWLRRHAEVFASMVARH